MHIYRLLLIFSFFFFVALHAVYDPTEFDIRMIYIHGATKHPYAQGKEHARNLWFAWNHACIQKRPKPYFIQRYIAMHDPDVFESYRRKHRLRRSDALKQQYHELYAQAQVLFEEIALFALRADGGLQAWRTALLQAGGILLVEGPDIEIESSDSSECSISSSEFYAQEYFADDERE